MAHHCHATNCPVKIPREQFVCRKHWYSLPWELRKRIHSTYQAGQCDDWQISHEYAEAARAAVRYIAELEGVEPDVSIYDALDPGPTESTGE